MRGSRPRVLVVLAVLAVIVGGCASGTAESSGTEDGEAVAAPSPSATEESSDMPMADEQSDAAVDDHASEAFAFGAPADPAEADRTVQVRGTDELAFDPATVEVRAGEVITFEVTNVGKIPHDFTLGDEHTQQEHERQMAEMGSEMAHVEPNAMTLGPGETGSITWRFHDAGEVLYGCHQPGHYDAGMVGSVDVTP